jgi:hypothetical protein
MQWTAASDGVPAPARIKRKSLASARLFYVSGSAGTGDFKVFAPVRRQGGEIIERRIVAVRVT